MVSACLCCFLCLMCSTFPSIILIILFSHRSDPTENDSVEGLRPNARGPGLVTFGVNALVLLDSNLTWCSLFFFTSPLLSLSLSHFKLVKAVRIIFCCKKKWLTISTPR